MQGASKIRAGKFEAFDDILQARMNESRKATAKAIQTERPAPARKSIQGHTTANEICLRSTATPLRKVNHDIVRMQGKRMYMDYMDNN